MASKEEFFKTGAMQFGVILGSGVISKIITDMLGDPKRDRVKDPLTDDEKKAEAEGKLDPKPTKLSEEDIASYLQKKALISAGLAAASIFAYEKIEDKVIAYGLIAGTGLVAARQAVSVPFVAKHMPDMFKGFLEKPPKDSVYMLKGDPDYIHKNDVKQIILDETKRLIKEAETAGYFPAKEEAVQVPTVNVEVGAQYNQSEQPNEERETQEMSGMDSYDETRLFNLGSED